MSIKCVISVYFSFPFAKWSPIIIIWYDFLLKWWLGQPQLPVTEQHVCGSCGEPQDVYGDHMLSCRKAGLIQRHTAIVQQLWHQSTAAGIQAVPEVSLDGRTRAADLLLSHWKGGGPCALDVAVVHPLAPSLPARSVKTGMEAIDHMVHVKVTKYGQSCNESKVSFLPFVLSTFGQLGADADHYCRHLASGLRPAAMMVGWANHGQPRTHLPSLWKNIFISLFLSNFSLSAKTKVFVCVLTCRLLFIFFHNVIRTAYPYGQIVFVYTFIHACANAISFIYF